MTSVLKANRQLELLSIFRNKTRIWVYRLFHIFGTLWILTDFLKVGFHVLDRSEKWLEMYFYQMEKLILLLITIFLAQLIKTYKRRELKYSSRKNPTDNIEKMYVQG